MNINKYTEKAQEAVLAAQQLAEQMSHPQIEPEHLLVALVEQRDGVVPELLRKMAADPAQIARGRARTARQDAAGVRRLAARPLAAAASAVADLAQAEAERLKDEYVSTEHLLLGDRRRDRALPCRAAAHRTRADAATRSSRRSPASAARSA